MPVLKTDSSTTTPSAMPTQLVNIVSSTVKPLDWETQLTKTVTKFITELSTTLPSWAWIGICTGILFVLGSLTICIFRGKICKLTNSITGKMGLKKTTDLQEVALLGKCDREKVLPDVINMI